jgi:hypothetical protein
MFSEKLERTLRKNPQWADRLGQIGQYLASLKRGQDVDPQVVSVRTGVPIGEVLALLQVLSEETVGRLQLRVVDPRGLEVATYQRRKDIPPVVEDAFGREIEVEPENVELVFKLSEQ